MKKTTLLLLLTLPLFTSAQIWDVLASGGKSESNSTHSLCYTVGEAAIWSANGNDHSAQQGFQQCSFDFDCVGIEDNIAEYHQRQLNLYPNPVIADLHVSGLPNGNHTLIVFSAEGKQIMNIQASENSTINLAQLAVGQYTLAVFHTETKTVFRSTFIKTNL